MGLTLKALVVSNSIEGRAFLSALLVICIKTNPSHYSLFSLHFTARYPINRVPVDWDGPSGAGKGHGPPYNSKSPKVLALAHSMCGHLLMDGPSFI